MSLSQPSPRSAFSLLVSIFSQLLQPFGGMSAFSMASSRLSTLEYRAEHAVELVEIALVLTSEARTM